MPFIAAGLPAMFGFTVYSSYIQAAASGKIPYPTAGEKIVGGHAIVAAGYDGKMKIKNTNPGSAETTGALLIRNSWGTKWGSGGYGWPLIGGHCSKTNGLIMATLNKIIGKLKIIIACWK